MKQQMKEDSCSSPKGPFTSVYRRVSALLFILFALVLIPALAVAGAVSNRGAGPPASEGKVQVGSAEESRQVSRVVELLQDRYDKTTDISARFRQRTFAAGDEKGVEAEGRVWFKRPELMRWEYETPEKKLIVTSGKDVYLYEEEVNQVTVISRERFLNSEISRAFFCGKGRLREYFKIDSACSGPEEGLEEAKECWSLRLIPRKETPNLKELVLHIDRKSHLIRAVTLLDQLGGRTEIVFSQIKVNSSVPDSLFHFTIPAGAEVFRLD